MREEGTRSVLPLGGTRKRKRLTPSCSWDMLLGDLDVYRLCDGGFLGHGDRGRLADRCGGTGRGGSC